jgi:VCBS repeat-containing protein
MDLFFRIVLIGIMTFNLTGNPAASIARIIPESTGPHSSTAPQSTPKPFGVTLFGQLFSPLLSLAPPVANDDSYSSIAEDTQLVVNAVDGVLANDSDPDNDPLTTEVYQNPGHGDLVFNPDGSFIYTPATDYNGPDSFQYRVYDGTSYSLPAMVSLTITPVNDLPVAADQTVTTDEDVAVDITLTATDVDLPGQPLTFTLLTPPGSGLLTGTPPNLTYTPELNYNGDDSFTFMANDGEENSLPATVHITIIPVNDAPVALDDSYPVTENMTLTVPAPGVLNNDSDVDNLVLTAELISPPSKGELTLAPSGGFTYIPHAYANGTDSFTYRTQDGTLSSQTATVTLTIAAVNHPPIAQPDAYTTAEDTPLVITAPGLMANDTDPDPEDVFTPTLVTGPQHGKLTPLILASDGSFSYTPDKDYNGPDAFTYYVKDGAENSNTVTVSLTITPVNDIPVAADQTVTTDEDVAVAITLTATDVDLPVQTLTFLVQTPPAHGTLSGTAPALTYTPELNYNGSDSFTFIAFDGEENSLPATIHITLTPVNDAPVANNQSVTTDEDVTAQITLTATDVDLPVQPLTYHIQTQPSHGTLTGTLPNLTYTPSSNYNGSDSFTFFATDGLLNSALATVNLTLTPVNDAPITYNKPCVVTPSGPDEEVKQYYPVDQEGILEVPAAEGVLVCDYEVDLDELGHPETFTAQVKTPPTKGTLTLNPDGSFRYVTNFGRNGDDSFTYRAFDGKDYSRETTVRIHIDLTTQYRVEWVTPKGMYIQYQLADPDPLKPPKTVRLNRYDVGTETVLIKVNVYKVKDAKSNITNEERIPCPECENMGLRLFRWNASSGVYQPITLLPAGQRTYAYDTTELNPGWNEIQAVAVYDGLVDTQNSGDASNRSEITNYLWRHNYSGPIIKLFLPVSTR